MRFFSLLVLALLASCSIVEVSRSAGPTEEQAEALCWSNRGRLASCSIVEQAEATARFNEELRQAELESLKRQHESDRRLERMLRMDPLDRMRESQRIIEENERLLDRMRKVQRVIEGNERLLDRIERDLPE